MQKATLNISGMSCQHCAARVTKALKSVPGVSNAAVDLGKGQAAVEFDPAQAKTDDLAKAVKAAGYTVTGAEVK